MFPPLSAPDPLANPQLDLTTPLQLDLPGVPPPEEALELPDTPEPEHPAQPDLRQALVSLPMTISEFHAWKKRIELSQQQIEARSDQWDALWRQYLPTITPANQSVAPRYQGHFRNTHTKIGQLFTRTPDVILSAKSRSKEKITQPPAMGPDGQLQPPKTLSAEDALAIRQAVINEQMREIGALDLMDQCLIDMQAYSGFSAVHVSYRSVSRTVQRPVMQPAPPTMPGPMGMAPPPGPPQPALGPDGQPLMQSVPVPIHERWDVEHIPAKKLLLDERLQSCRYDKDSRWIGRAFYMSKRMAQRLYGLTDQEVEAAVTGDDKVFQDDIAQSNQSDEKDLLKGYECWCKAEHFTDEDNPDAVCQLVIFDCVADKPVVWRPSLHQTFDDTGRLTEDSLEGFPIIVGSLRPALDSPFPFADSAFVDGDVKHISTHRQQMVAIRDAAVGKLMLDSGVFDEADRDALIHGTAGHLIMVKPGTLAQGSDKVMALSAQVHSTPDDWRTAALLKADMDETLGISTPQTGGQMDTVRSATEVATMNQGALGRSSKEQDRVVQFYLKIVRAVDTLIFRYATGNRYVEIVGESGAKRLEMWNKHIGSGKFAYDIKPDSQLTMDAARDRQQLIGLYNVVAPDPLTNRQPILQKLAQKFGMDPAETVLSQDVVNAQTAASQMMGAPVGQPPTGGGPVSKHAMERSGGTPNGPQKAATGDNRQERNPRGPGSPA
jgi:hypothetical protein